METFIEELSSKKVLSKDDIILLKQYISKKYLNYTKKQKSHVLSQAIYRIIDNSVSGLDKHYIKLVKKDILNNTIIKNGNPVLFSDIFQLCISLKDEPDILEHTLLDWVNLHIKNKISKTDLEIYCSKNPISCEDFVSTPYVEYAIKSNSDSYAYNTKNSINSILIKLKSNSKHLVLAFFSVILIMLTIKSFLKINNTIIEKHNSSTSSSLVRTITNKKAPAPNIAVHFEYKEINTVVLKTYLNSHNSLLAEEPYFSTIIAVSKQYNLNPFILFAISGQEESFVSKQDPNSKKIANNPYNVYHSWKEYNTNIKDASEIASLTVINLSKDRPATEELFHWINRKYAEDPNWSKGVKNIYEALEKNDYSGN